MTLLGGMTIGLRNGVLALSLLALSGCTTLTSSGIAVTQTGDNPAPTVVPQGTDPSSARSNRHSLTDFFPCWSNRCVLLRHQRQFRPAFC